MNDRSKYGSLGGYDPSRHAIWTRDFSKIKPLVDWNNTCGCLTMTYNAPMKKYRRRITGGGNTISKSNAYILESHHIAGSWQLVVCLRDFGEQGHFVNIPSTFISAGSRTGLLCRAAYFTKVTCSPTTGTILPAAVME
jgi:hypothetical protein